MQQTTSNNYNKHNKQNTVTVTLYSVCSVFLLDRGCEAEEQQSQTFRIATFHAQFSDALASLALIIVTDSSKLTYRNFIETDGPKLEIGHSSSLTALSVSPSALLVFKIAFLVFYPK